MEPSFVVGGSLCIIAENWKQSKCLQRGMDRQDLVQCSTIEQLKK
jgi:hypothetical protein